MGSVKADASTGSLQLSKAAGSAAAADAGTIRLDIDSTGAARLTNESGTSITLGSSQSVSDILSGASAFTQLNLGSFTTITVTSNTAAITKSGHKIDTSGGAVTINTLTGGADGDILILTVTNNTTATLTNADNIVTRNGQNLLIRTINDYAAFVFQSTKWREIGPAPFELYNGVTATTPLTPSGLILSPGVMKNSSGRTPELLILGQPQARRWYSIVSSANNIAGTGITPVAVNGGQTAAADSSGMWTNFASAASIAALAGVSSNTYNVTYTDLDPTIRLLVKTGSSTDLTLVRNWIGLFSAVPTNVDDLAAGTKGLAFRGSSVAGDTNWMMVVDDGSTASAASSGVAIAANTVYLFSIRLSYSTSMVYFSINNGAETGVSLSGLSFAATTLGHAALAIATTAAARNIKFGALYCEMN